MRGLPTVRRVRVTTYAEVLKGFFVSKRRDEVVLDALLPVYVQSRVFNALLQSSAAKHAATQKAMKSASDNADKLITDYTRLRNNARQAEITQQIAEIVGGADALASGK